MRVSANLAGWAIPLLSFCVPGRLIVAQPPQLDTPIIVTAAPDYQPLAALRGGERFPGGAHLLLFENGHAMPLVPDFAEAADANVSFDAKTVLFAGKRDSNAKWAVWELTVANGSARLVAEGATDLIRPLYLPGGRLVYARDTNHEYRMETAQLDGTNVLPLTYMQAGAVPDDVLADGRVLFEAGFPLGTAVVQGATPEMFLVYSDGSGVESYRCDHGRARWAGRQLRSGDVLFTHGQTLARFTSPLAEEARVTAPRGEFAGAIAEMTSGTLLVSARANRTSHYALKTWKTGAMAMQTILSIKNVDLVEPVVLEPRERPKRHPSGLHDWDYGNLLALDARLSREGSLQGAPSSVQVEMMDRNGNSIVLGTAPVEQDGSFFVKAPADRPIRFSLFDKHGAIMSKEHGWFWIRRGEQRICVGCHAGPERAPENRVPAVLLRTTTPVDLSGAQQKINSAPAATGGR